MILGGVFGGGACSILGGGFKDGKGWGAGVVDRGGEGRFSGNGGFKGLLFSFFILFFVK